MNKIIVFALLGIAFSANALGEQRVRSCNHAFVLIGSVYG